MNISSNDTALKIWSEVLAGMPVELHSKYALAEARRRLIGMDDGDALQRALEQLAVDAFGPDQVVEVSGNVTDKNDPVVLPEAAIEAEVVRVVQAAFATTIDGSFERAQVLKNIGLENAERVLDEHRENLGWFARRRIRKAAHRAAQKEMASVVNTVTPEAARDRPAN